MRASPPPMKREAAKASGLRSVTSISYPRRQQYRHAARAIGYGALVLLVLGFAIAAAASRNGTLALVLVAAAGALALESYHSVRLAGRNRVGADSESQVRHRLHTLRRDGWEVRHGIGWPGGGDIDHLVRSPSGFGFVIETKTRSFNERHLRRTMNAARWAAGKRRRYSRGVVAVLCIARAHNLEEYRGEVLLVSADRLLHALRNRAGD